jgi:hypothetical protein
MYPQCNNNKKGGKNLFNHNTMTQTRELTQIQDSYLNYNPYLNFSQFLPEVCDLDTLGEDW